MNVDKEFKYRNSNYFNANDTYMFLSINGDFQSKVHFENGYWWTNESLNYKATTIECYNLTLKRKIINISQYGDLSEYNIAVKISRELRDYIKNKDFEFLNEFEFLTKLDELLYEEIDLPDYLSGR